MKKYLTDAQVQWAYDRWCEGYKVADLCKVLCISERALRTDMRKVGGKKISTLPPLVLPQELRFHHEQNEQNKFQ